MPGQPAQVGENLLGKEVRCKSDFQPGHGAYPVNRTIFMSNGYVPGGSHQTFCKLEITMRHCDKELIKESRRGHINRMDRLLKAGANVNCRGKYGHTPLMEAASQGHLEAVHYLLDYGADPSICADDNAPPTFYACVHGYAEVVELLLAKGADPNALRDHDYRIPPEDSAGISQLHIVINHGFTRIAIALINAGANIDHITHGRTVLQASMSANMNDIVDLIRGKGFDGHSGSVDVDTIN